MSSDADAEIAGSDAGLPKADPGRGNREDDSPDRRGPSSGRKSDETEETTVVPPIPDDPVTDTYPLLARLEDEDDSQRLQAFTQVLTEMRGELDRLPDPDAPRRDGATDGMAGGDRQQDDSHRGNQTDPRQAGFRQNTAFHQDRRHHGRHGGGR